MKKRNAILALCLTMALLLAACAPAANNPQQENVPPAPTETAQPSPELGAEAETAAFTPGTYRVETMGHNAIIVIDVTFSSDRLEDITVVEQKESKSIGNWAMDAMGTEIIERQSLNVDTLSGATVTGAVFRNAIRKAVENAGGDPNAMMTPATETSTSPLPDEHVNIVVVGAGGAGLAATVEAFEQGMNVILIEQLGIVGGSSARAGGMNAADSRLLKDNGITFTAKEMYDYLTQPLSDTLDPGLLDEEYCAGFAGRSGKNIDWLQDMGVKFGTPWGGMNHWGDGQSRVAWSIVESLRNKMDQYGVDYRLNTKGLELVTDGADVVGVLAQAPNGTTYTIYADAVVLATGTYLANKEMVAKYMPGYENNGYDVSIGADGSGIVMAEKVGGVPTLMHLGGFHALSTNYNGVSRSLTVPSHFGGIAVNEAGERYANEDGAYADFTAASMKQKATFCIMDETVLSSEAIASDIGLSCIREMYTKADTLEELAKELGIDPDGLVATAKKYGEYVRNGVDEDFDKAATGLISDFSSGPYYGVKAVVENHTIYGGIKTDSATRVLRADGSIIKGLYAAGEVALMKTAARAPLPECIDTGRWAVAEIVKNLSNN